MTDRTAELLEEIINDIDGRVKDEGLTVGETLVLLSILKASITGSIEALIISQNKKLMETPMEQTL